MSPWQAGRQCRHRSRPEIAVGRHWCSTVTAAHARPCTLAYVASSRRLAIAASICPLVSASNQPSNTETTEVWAQHTLHESSIPFACLFLLSGLHKGFTDERGSETMLVSGDTGEATSLRTLVLPRSPFLHPGVTPRMRVGLDPHVKSPAGLTAMNFGPE